MDDNSTTLWRFVRGDLAVADFEVWLYRHQSLEHELGAEFYNELISFDYRDRQELFVLRKKLGAFLRPALMCECVTLPDMAMVPMGVDGLDRRVFATVRPLQEFGSSKWWLSLRHCSVCGQKWLVAQEERIYDDYFMRRLDEVEAQDILNGGLWPPDFSTYEQVLRVGKEISAAFRFSDELDKTLVWTAQDLRNERPDMTVQEIAELLGIDSDHADRLLAAAQRLE
jgi:hypothetical protein